MIRALTCVLLALTTAGCNGAGDAGDDGTASTGDATTTATVGESSTSVGTATATTDAETTGMTTAATEPPGMTGSTGEDTTTTGEDTTTTGEDTTTTGEDTTTGAEACVEPDFDPDPKGRSGESCFMDAECGDGEQCFVIPLLGGICGECLVDADCPDGGCTLPNPLAGVGAVCNTGKPGSGCESDEVCDSECNTICGVALDAVPIITVSTCGACGSSEDCSGGTICTPEVNLSEFSGINHCAAPGSVADNGTCSLEAGGEAACASGICSVAAVMGVVKIGVCGACLSDADCGEGLTCIDAYADPNSGEFFGSVCVIT